LRREKTRKDPGTTNILLSRAYHNNIIPPENGTGDKVPLQERGGRGPAGVIDAGGEEEEQPKYDRIHR